MKWFVLLAALVEPIGTCTLKIGTDVLLLKSTEKACKTTIGGLWSPTLPNEKDPRCGNCNSDQT